MTVEANHTPGPWNIMPLRGKYYGTEISLGENHITVWTPNHCAEPFASVREIENGWMPEDGQDHVEDVESYSNALLISAAPDLLAALRELLTYFNEDLASIMNDELLAVLAARTAIAKALGEQQ